MTEPSAPITPRSCVSTVWRWLVGHPVFPLLLVCSASAGLSMGLLACRKMLTGQGRLGFIPFNLLLAFLPLFFLLLSEHSRRRRSGLLCAGLWLLFFPNAPYMLTDLVHYDKRLGPASWLDLLALVAAGWAALLGGMVTLRFMHDRVRLRRTTRAGHSFVVVVLFLSAVGIYIGRFLRFHSWHALTNPLDLLTETATRFLQPAGHPIAWPFTLGVFGLLCCIYYSLLAFTHAARWSGPGLAAENVRDSPGCG